MKNNRKKIVSTICLAACLLAASAPAALAAGTAELPDSVIVTPYMVYISNSSCDLSISNGQASVTASVTGYAGETTKCSVVAELQEQSGSSWKTVQTWSSTKESYRASVSGSKAVTAGKTYRVKATVTVWAGAASESKTIITGIKTA